MRLNLARVSAFIAVVGLAAGLSGCGRSDIARATVKGTVKIGDKMLNSGTVVFTAKDKSGTGSSPIDADGNYSMKDAPVGEVLVSVTVPKSLAMAGKMPKMPNAPADAGMKGAPAGLATGAGLTDPSKVVKIPEKYGSPETSALTFKVEKGEQTHNITLSQ